MTAIRDVCFPAGVLLAFVLGTAWTLSVLGPLSPRAPDEIVFAPAHAHRHRG